MKKWLAAGLISLSVLGLSACSTSVKRVDVNEQIDLSGAWNDTDSRLVSEEMIQDALSRPWVSEFAFSKGHAPAVIVGNSTESQS